MAKRCRQCRYRNTCENKETEALAYMQDTVVAPASAALTELASAEITVKHDYRNIYIDKDTSVTIDLEELKEQMRQDFYKSIGLGVVLGG